jgi:UBX domain-containing protein 7
LKAFIKSYLIFWQTGTDTVEGNRVKVYYNAHQCPYVAIIDPRTGEEMQGYRSIFPFTAEQFLAVLEKFIAENGMTPEKDEVEEEEEAAASTSNHTTTSTNTSKKRPNERDDNDAPSTSKAKKSATITEISGAKKSVVNLTEEEQLELALKQSLQETCFRDNKSSSQSPPPELSSDSSDFEEPAEADENVNDESVKKFMEPAKINDSSVCDEVLDENGKTFAVDSTLTRLEQHCIISLFCYLQARKHG